MSTDEFAPGEAPQKSAFLGGEGDAYEVRNRNAEGLDGLLLDRLAAWLKPGNAVLEIGCGAGQNLRALATRVPGLLCHGIDPSHEAITSARAAAPHDGLEIGTADALPFDSATFNLVLFGFCLYVCDRELLHRSVAEADRVLLDAQAERTGVLAIVDFDPERPLRRPYRHREGLWTFKMDYSQLFLANPAYRLSDKIPFTHDAKPPTCSPDPDKRLAMWVLHKDTRTAFPLPD